MSGLGVTSVIWLLIAVSFTASMCGYLGSAIAARRNNQRSRRSFALGFVCGSISAAVLRRKYRPATRAFLLAALPGNSRRRPSRPAIRWSPPN